MWKSLEQLSLCSCASLFSGTTSWCWTFSLRRWTTRPSSRRRRTRWQVCWVGFNSGPDPASHAMLIHASMNCCRETFQIFRHRDYVNKFSSELSQKLKTVKEFVLPRKDIWILSHSYWKPHVWISEYDQSASFKEKKAGGQTRDESWLNRKLLLTCRQQRCQFNQNRTRFLQ